MYGTENIEAKGSFRASIHIFINILFNMIGSCTPFILRIWWLQYLSTSGSAMPLTDTFLCFLWRGNWHTFGWFCNHLISSFSSSIFKAHSHTSQKGNQFVYFGGCPWSILRIYVLSLHYSKDDKIVENLNKYLPFIFIFIFTTYLMRCEVYK